MWKGILYLLQIQLEDQESGQEFQPLLQENFHLGYMFLANLSRKFSEQFLEKIWLLCKKIQRFSILMIFFCQISPETFQNNFSKFFGQLCKRIQRFSTVMIFSGKYFPSIQISRYPTKLKSGNENCWEY